MIACMASSSPITSAQGDYIKEGEKRGAFACESMNDAHGRGLAAGKSPMRAIRFHHSPCKLCSHGSRRDTDSWMHESKLCRQLQSCH